MNLISRRLKRSNMHKFTLFTIGLSVVVILVVAEVVVNNYFGEDFAKNGPSVEENADDLVVPEVVAEVTDDVAVTEEISDDVPAEDSPILTSQPDLELRGDEEVIAEVSDEVPVLPVQPIGKITTELLTNIGVLEPRIENAPSQGLVFGFFDVEKEFSGWSAVEYTLFDGPNFIGTVYEIGTDNELQAFGAYETLRQKAEGSSLGKMNENNSYGEASFYFNHSTKTNTVFLVVRLGLEVYALQYSPTYHGSIIKPLLEKL